MDVFGNSFNLCATKKTAMSYGFCSLSSIPVRAESSDKSEMVNQLLFGEMYTVLDEREKWIKIQGAFDQYSGWIDRKQHTELTEKTFNYNTGTNKLHCVADLMGVVHQTAQNAMFPILLGSSLPDFKNNTVSFDENTFEFEGLTVHGKPADLRTSIVEFAYNYLNAPYLWGGRSPLGIDCSGFTQMTYKLAGLSIPRDASQQAELGYLLSFVEEAEPGDLAFFDNEEGSIIHVGIVLENNYIIHASGKVRIDRIDHQGIFNPETRRYTHKLRLLKSML